jgi:hypothetical protein
MVWTTLIIFIPLSHFPFTLPTPADSHPKTVTLFYTCVIFFFPLGLNSPYETEHDTCLSHSGFFCLTWWLPVPSIFLYAP